MTKETPPARWRFPPTGGGAEQGRHPGQQHFSNDPLPKMVREVLQNSLDHPEPGLPTVQVTFRTIKIDPAHIGLESLNPHIRASAMENVDPREQRAPPEDHPTAEPLTCLAITDANTTGLQGPHWTNLVLREGFTAPQGAAATGGSHGLGKNAPFNLSTLHTVVYSTRYVDRAARGRTTRTLGRSQLATHDDPDNPGRRLQGTGFLAHHDPDREVYNQPLEGPEIPPPFRLDQTGTGIYIIGFDQEEHPDWPKLVTQTAATNFLLAIHRGTLEVRVEPTHGCPPVTLDAHSLPTHLEDLEPRNPARHAHAALRTQPQRTRAERSQDGIQGLEVWTTGAPEAPHRLLHFNRRGMLVTSSRERKDNPLFPPGGSTWNPWCAVTTAADEETERMIRLMEPPAHDAILPAQLTDRRLRERTTRELARHREQIRNIITMAIDQAPSPQRTNAEELALLFPDLPQGQELRWQTAHYEPEPEDPPPADGSTETSVENPEPREPGTQLSPRRRKEEMNQKHPRTIRNTRLIRQGPGQLTITLTMPPEGRAVLEVTSAGEQYQRTEEPARIASVSTRGCPDAKASLQGNRIHLTAPAETVATMDLTINGENTLYPSYRVVQLPDPGDRP